MPSQSTPPQLSLQDLIVRFRDDCAMAHDFIKGDETLDITGEAGSYPSLAKLVASTKNALDTVIKTQLGFAYRTYSFSESLVWVVTHSELPTRHFSETILDLNGQRVYAPIRIIDENEFHVEFTEATAGDLSVLFRT